MNYVFMFPGQNSRYPDMLDRLSCLTSMTNDVLRSASDILGRDLAHHYRGDNPRIFGSNRDVQLGVFLASYISARMLEAQGVRPAASVGLSLGEYNHLVEIGALDFTAALRLLEARGDAYDAGPHGMMMAVFPCDAEQVEAALVVGRALGPVDIAIRLAPRNYVLAGACAAVEASAGWLEDEAYAHARVIDSQLPMHVPMFKPTADVFRDVLAEVAWGCAKSAYMSNVDASFNDAPAARDFVDCLYRHVFSTVQWWPSVNRLCERFPDATFIEVGPKTVLHDLVSREHRSLRVRCVDGASAVHAC